MKSNIQTLVIIFATVAVVTGIVANAAIPTVHALNLDALDIGSNLQCNGVLACVDSQECNGEFPICNKDTVSSEPVI